MTPQEIEIANARVAGVSIGQIGTKNNMPKSTVQNKLSKKEIADYIAEQKQMLLTTSLKKSVENINHAIDNYQTADNNTRIDHGLKCSLIVSEAAGITPSRTPTIQIIGDITISNTVQQIIQRFGQAISQPEDVIECPESVQSE